MTEDRRGTSGGSPPKTGQLYFDELQERHSCLVCSADESGAVIEADLMSSYFRHLRLVSADLCIDKICIVTWRDGRKIGLEFTT